MTMTATTPKKATQSRRKTVTVTLSVTGEWLTDISRRLMLEQPARRAYEFLQRGIHAAPDFDQNARKLLDGELRLGGDSTKGLSWVKDRSAEAKRYRADLKTHYAGRVRIDGAWWRPVARVTAVGAHDAAYAVKRANWLLDYAYQRIDLDRCDLVQSPTLAELDQFHALRVAYYAREGERVVSLKRPELEHLHRHNHVLFEPVAELPFWWTEPPSPEAAYEAHLAAGHDLEDRGSNDERQDTPKPKLSSEEKEALRLVQEAQEEEEEAQEKEEDAQRLAMWREKILKAANGDMIELVLDDGQTRSVPRAPFLRWALKHPSGRLSPSRQQLPPWETVCPSGLKLQMDDPYHSDWMVGGGIDLAESYNSPVSKAADTIRYELLYGHLGDSEETPESRPDWKKRTLGPCPAVVLTSPDDPTISGVVGTRKEPNTIVVLPDLHPDHLPLLLAARGVITQAGGQLAHLAQVALERRIPIVLVPDALTRFPPGTHLTITPSTGEVVVHG